MFKAEKADEAGEGVGAGVAKRVVVTVGVVVVVKAGKAVGAEVKWVVQFDHNNPQVV